MRVVFLYPVISHILQFSGTATAQAFILARSLSFWPHEQSHAFTDTGLRLHGLLQQNKCLTKTAVKSSHASIRQITLVISQEENPKTSTRPLILQAKGPQASPHLRLQAMRRKTHIRLGLLTMEGMRHREKITYLVRTQRKWAKKPNLTRSKTPSQPTVLLEKAAQTGPLKVHPCTVQILPAQEQDQSLGYSWVPHIPFSTSKQCKTSPQSWTRNC